MDPRTESKIWALEQEVAELKRRLDAMDAVDAQVAAANGPWAPPLPVPLVCTDGGPHIFHNWTNGRRCNICNAEDPLG